MTKYYAFHEPVVIANEVKQSRNPEPIDCHATSTTTKSYARNDGVVS